MRNNFLPTPKAEWVEAGDRCVLSQSGWEGIVIKVVPLNSLPYCVVLWDMTKKTGRVLITQLRRAK